MTSLPDSSNGDHNGVVGNSSSISPAPQTIQVVHDATMDSNALANTPTPALTTKRNADAMLNERSGEQRKDNGHANDDNELKRIKVEDVHRQNSSRGSSGSSTQSSPSSPPPTNRAASDAINTAATITSPSSLQINRNAQTASSRNTKITNNDHTNGETQRWRSHRMAEDYISLCANMMLPETYLAPFGYDAPSGQYPIQSITALSFLTSSSSLSPQSALFRRPSVVEKWCPYEIAVFESALALCGKHFHQVQKFVKTKNTKEVIEFYYIWKKTAHYKVWKRQYVSPDDDVDSDDD